MGKYTQHRLNKELNGIKELAGLDNIDQVKDIMKYTNLSTKDLEELLKTSSIESILGIDDMN